MAFTFTGAFSGASNPFTTNDAAAAASPHDHSAPHRAHSFPTAPTNGTGDFDVLDWHQALQSCQRYFLSVAQHDEGTQALMALVNIELPCQWATDAVHNAEGRAPGSRPLDHPGALYFNSVGAHATPPPPPKWVSLVPYVRRLVVTGMERDAVYHGVFGDDWRKGVGPLIEVERRNYLFAAKSGGWLRCKEHYDMGARQTVPFMNPPKDIDEKEITNAESQWSDWMMVEDWLVGSRAPEQ